MIRVALASLAAGLLLAVAACGGSSSGQLSKSDYESQVGTIAVGLTGAIQAIGEASTIKGTVTALRQAEATFAKAADELDAITPPDDIADPHAALAKAVRDFGEELHPILGRVQKGNRLAVTGIQALPAIQQIIRASADIGHKGYNLGGDELAIG